MNILETLETSYNRKIQTRIFDEMDMIDEADNQYLNFKNQFKKKFIDQTSDLVKDRNMEMALLKGYRKDNRDALKTLKLKHRSQYLQAKEDLNFALGEEKQSVQLIMNKIDTNYRKARIGYLEAISKGDTKAISELETFESKFREYREIELLERTRIQTENIEKIKDEYETKVSKIETEYKQALENYKASQSKEVVKDFKEKKKSAIAYYQSKIKAFEKEMKEAETLKKEEFKLAFETFKVTKKHHEEKIKEIKKEAADRYSTMSYLEKVTYDEYQNYINQDYRSRRLQRADEREALLFKNINTAYIYVGPAFLGEILFTLLPFIFMIIGSFFRIDFTNLGKSRFVGLKNFIDIFTKDTEFQKSISNTAIYAVITIVLLTAVTVTMAAWLSKNTRIHNLAQSMVFTPHIASLVSISIIWIAMLNPSGLINQLLAFFGIEGPAWLLQENTSLFSVSLVTVWKDIGYYVLIIISGLQGIPTYVYEAAKLDKASKATQFFRITLPLLAPTLSFVFLTKFINSFKVFAPIEIMTNGGPMGSSMVLSYWIYKVGRIGFNYGQAMAGSIILTLMIAFCTVLKNVYFDRTVKY